MVIDIIVVLGVFKLPFFELPDVFGLDSELGPVVLGHLDSVLPGDDIFEFFHFKVDSFENFRFRDQPGKLVDLVEFGLEFF